MLPIDEINIGDQFENPMHRPWGLIFIVDDIKTSEKMVKVHGIKSDGQPFGKPIWKKNTDRMFSEDWRVFNIKHFLNNTQVDKAKLS